MTREDDISEGTNSDSEDDSVEWDFATLFNNLNLECASLHDADRRLRYARLKTQRDNARQSAQYNGDPIPIFLEQMLFRKNNRCVWNISNLPKCLKWRKLSCFLSHWSMKNWEPVPFPIFHLKFLTAIPWSALNDDTILQKDTLMNLYPTDLTVGDSKLIDFCSALQARARKYLQSVLDDSESYDVEEGTNALEATAHVVDWLRQNSFFDTYLVSSCKIQQLFDPMDPSFELKTVCRQYGKRWGWSFNKRELHAYQRIMKIPTRSRKGGGK